MAQIPKYSPKGRSALEKQVSDYQELLNKLMLENPAFKPSTPIVISGKSETETKDNTTRNPSPTDPGGSTDKWSKTTNEPQQVIAMTAGEDAVRKRGDDLVTFINTARGDLADEAKLAQRIPIGTEEALEIGLGQATGTPSFAKLKSFSDALGVKGTGSPIDRAQAMLMSGVTPNDGFTMIRSLFPGARENPRLLAELMGIDAASTGLDYGRIADWEGTWPTSRAGVEQQLRATLGGQTGGAGVEQALGATIDQIDTHSDSARQLEKQLVGAGGEAQRMIGANRKFATIAGVLSAAGVGAGAALWPTSETTKFNEKALKTLLGSSSIDMELYKKDPGMALGNAFGAYADREFGRAKKKPQYARYDAMMKKYAQTIARLGEGTLKLTDTDEGLSGLRSDLSSFYAAAPGYEGYNSSNPIAFPYVSGKNPGVITIDKNMKHLARLKDATEFAAIDD